MKTVDRTFQVEKMKPMLYIEMCFYWTMNMQGIDLFPLRKLESIRFISYRLVDSLTIVKLSFGEYFSLHHIGLYTLTGCIMAHGTQKHFFKLTSDMQHYHIELVNLCLCGKKNLWTLHFNYFWLFFLSRAKLLLLVNAKNLSKANISNHGKMLPFHTFWVIFSAQALVWGSVMMSDDFS